MNAQTLASPREPGAILADFAAGADRLTAIAGDWQQRQFKPGDLAGADSVLRGLGHCLAELRQGACDGS
jgi:hypothetical protein